LVSAIVKKLYHKLVNLGIHPDTPFDLRNKVTVFNNANIIVCLISLFYALIGLNNHYYWGVALTGYSVFSTSFSLYLVHKGHYRFAFHYIMFYGFLFISSFSYLFGAANNSHYYFLFLPVVANIFFDELRVTIMYLCICIVVMLANVIYIESSVAYYIVPDSMRFFGYPNIPFICLLIFLGVRLFKQENLKYAATIEEQRQSLEEKNREITDSINYAKKIQEALIPAEEEFNAYFKESYVLFKPKDIVSGDFYWAARKQNKVFYAAADCTGHGVPGGFMTMLGLTFLDEIVNEKNISEPAVILNHLRDRIITTLKQTGNAGENKDGMDIALCCIDTDTNTLHYAAANNSVYLLRNNQLQELKPDKQPCGFHHDTKPFTSHSIQLQANDCIYTFSDGYADQFGGEKGKKFKYKKLEELLISSHTNFKDQKNLLDTTFETWKGSLEQVDDILLIGIRV
jgi:sigma-B regulation protein RsbU (phosphoserine phosphatase)